MGAFFFAFGVSGMYSLRRKKNLIIVLRTAGLWPAKDLQINQVILGFYSRRKKVKLRVIRLHASSHPLLRYTGLCPFA
jgi:hypothetical protein